MNIKNVIQRNKAINKPFLGTRKAGGKLAEAANKGRKQSKKNLRSAVKNLKNDQFVYGVKGSKKELRADRRSAIKAYAAGGKVVKPVTSTIRNARAKMLKTARKLKYGYN